MLAIVDVYGWLRDCSNYKIDMYKVCVISHQVRNAELSSRDRDGGEVGGQASESEVRLVRLAAEA